ncbi:MAG: phosphatidylglycerophosphatase A [Desulfobacterales bacterium]|uniref:Phosphatidylglycerophosphatase A n=1 Tax=Candidatus Desulfatibia vada TaxID=2841696 RepID=A0A8J6TPJ5_9BACT|nr:phosphatidylglycerophosphatase A [Candidatus Desulfatibia vada]MBL6971566.1 phosphatidylglycerophosphatase A [Desulfobacterales bacterium]
MNFKQKAVMFLATGCFIGNISFAPGTFGSILGLPLCFLLSKTDLPVAVLLAVLFIFFAILISQEAEKLLGEKDPGAIVVDEIAGIVVTLTGLPFNLFFAAAGFIIFRILDIFKPYPIRLLEKHLSGGAGIVLDDVAAGILSNLVLRAILLMNS